MYKIKHYSTERNDFFYLKVRSGRTRDLYAHARRIGKDIQLFYPHFHGLYAGFAKAEIGEAFCKRLDKIHVSGRCEFPDLHDQVLVAQDVRKPVLDGVRRLQNRQIQVDPNALGSISFVPVHANQTVQHKVVDKDAPRFGKGVAAGCVETGLADIVLAFYSSTGEPLDPGNPNPGVDRRPARSTDPS